MVAPKTRDQAFYPLQEASSGLQTSPLHNRNLAL